MDMHIESLVGRPRDSSRGLRDIIRKYGVVRIRGVSCDESGILEYAERLGSSRLNIPEQLTGPPVMHLRFDESKAQSTSRPAYFTSSEFPLHTDLSYVDNPPRYLLTLCIRADANQPDGSVRLIRSMLSLSSSWWAGSAVPAFWARFSSSTRNSAAATGRSSSSAVPPGEPRRRRKS